MRTFTSKEKRTLKILHGMRHTASQLPVAPSCIQRAKVRNILQSAGIQTKLRVSHPEDMYELEADRVADQVMGMPNQPHEFTGRQADSETHGPAASDLHSTGVNHQNGLDQNTQTFMERRFGHSFENVQVHTDNKAATSAALLGARAFTKGNHVYFGAGQYQPQSHEGKHLIAHELTHVVQQGGNNEVHRSQDDVDNHTSGSQDELRSANNQVVASLEAADTYLKGNEDLDTDIRQKIMYLYNMLKPVKRNYQAVLNGEAVPEHVTIDFDPIRDEIIPGSGEQILRLYDLEGGTPPPAPEPQLLSSPMQRPIITPHTGSETVQTAVCGGLCIGLAIAAAALLLSGCKTQSKNKQGPLSYKWLNDPSFNGCGSVTWLFDFVVDSRQNGCIIQEIENDRTAAGGSKVSYVEAWCDVLNKTPSDYWNITAKGHPKGTIIKTGWAKFYPNMTKQQLLKEGWGDAGSKCSGKSGSAPCNQVDAVKWWTRQDTLKRAIGIKDFNCSGGNKGTLIWEK